MPALEGHPHATNRTCFSASLPGSGETPQATTGRQDKIHFLLTGVCNIYVADTVENALGEPQSFELSPEAPFTFGPEWHQIRRMSQLKVQFSPEASFKFGT